eukprot:3741425-Prymnesium_polylepis.1
MWHLDLARRNCSSVLRHPDAFAISWTPGNGSSLRGKKCEKVITSSEASAGAACFSAIWSRASLRPLINSHTESRAVDRGGRRRNGTTRRAAPRPPWSRAVPQGRGSGGSSQVGNARGQVAGPPLVIRQCDWPRRQCRVSAGIRGSASSRRQQIRQAQRVLGGSAAGGARLRGADVDVQLVAHLPEGEELLHRVGEHRRLVRVLPTWPDPHVVVARHVEDAPEARAERLEAVLDGDERVADVARDDERVILVRRLRERRRPLLGARMVIVDVRDAEDARGRTAGIAREALDPPLVARRQRRVERHDRRVAPVEQLAVRGVLEQPIGVKPIGGLLVATTERRETRPR